MAYEYITEELSLKTKYKTIVNAYQNNDLSVVLQNNQYWYMERCATNKLYELVKKEMERLFPHYQYVFAILKKNNCSLSCRTVTAILSVIMM